MSSSYHGGDRPSVDRIYAHPNGTWSRIFAQSDAGDAPSYVRESDAGDLYDGLQIENQKLHRQVLNASRTLEGIEDIAAEAIHRGGPMSSDNVEKIRRLASAVLADMNGERTDNQ